MKQEEELYFKQLRITHIDIYFQPIISIKKKRIFGYEALLRGYKDEQYIAPDILFKEAKSAGLALELDKLVRLESINKFKKFFEQDNRLLLFLNFESSSINDSFKSEQYSFEDTLTKLNIPAKNIVLEIKEDEVKSTLALKNFSTYYKERGFNIAIDDFGTGESQFDRLSIVKPDIVKIDKSLLRDIDSNDINAEILKSIANMCKNIGAISLCEGVEYESEILKSLNFGIDIFQGYFFAHPSNVKPNHKSISNKIITVGLEHKNNLESIIKSKNELLQEACDISQKIISIMTSDKDNQKKSILNIIKQEQQVEALYFISSHDAKQIGETILLASQRGFYEPSVHGENHSLQDYYYICKNSKDGKYISQKYISTASGNICRTFSKRFLHDSNELILCIDLYLK